MTCQEVTQAERQIDQQVYLLAATEQQLLIDVASAYFDILRAYEVLEARLAQERAIGRQLEQAREQFEVGLMRHRGGRGAGELRPVPGGPYCRRATSR